MLPPTPQPRDQTKEPPKPNKSANDAAMALHPGIDAAHAVTACASTPRAHHHAALRTSLISRRLVAHLAPGPM